MRVNGILKSVDLIAGVGAILFLLPFFLLKRLLSRKRRQIKRDDLVLVIKLSAMGDTLLLYPVLAEIKKKMGNDGKISLICTAVNRQVSEMCPHVDEVFCWQPLSPVSWFKLFRFVRKQRYALTLDFDQWTRISALISAVSRCRIRAGFKTRGQHRHYLYDFYVLNTNIRHEGVQFRDMAGIFIGEGSYHYFSTLKKDWNINVAKMQNRIIVHPGCGGHGQQREWPIENFAALLEEAKLKSDKEIHITGYGEHEAELAEKLMKLLPAAVNRVGQMDFRGTVELLASADLVICGNTGVMHLAHGLGVQVLALHGPTNSLKWGPFGDGNAILCSSLACSPCLEIGNDYGCRGRYCMENIQVEQVKDKMFELLEHCI